VRYSGNFFILTGGPGAGKTTLLAALAATGYACPAEAGRGVIQDQLAIDGMALPWRQPLLFAELMLSWDMRSYRMAQDTTGAVVFDRGVPDIIGYLRTVGQPVPVHVERAARQFRYNRTAFIAPPWPEIFQQDAERRQSLEEAERTYESILTVYKEQGYELLELPRAPVAERVTFVRAHIDQALGSS
jgi:predicted ATPase